MIHKLEITLQKTFELSYLSSKNTNYFVRLQTLSNSCFCHRDQTFVMSTKRRKVTYPPFILSADALGVVLGFLSNRDKLQLVTTSKLFYHTLTTRAHAWLKKMAIQHSNFSWQYQIYQPCSLATTRLIVSHDWLRNSERSRWLESSFPNIVRLHVIFKHDSIHMFELPIFKNIQELILDYRGHLSNKTLNLRLDGLRLKSLMMVRLWIRRNDLASIAPQLKTLKLFDVSFDSDGELPIFPRVTNLKLLRCYHSVNIEWYFPAVTNLHYVCHRNQQQRISAFTNLIKLTVEDLVDVVDIARLRFLEELTVNYAKIMIQTEFWGTMTPWYISDEDLQPLQHMSTLKTFRISNCPHIRKDGLKYLPPSLNKLFVGEDMKIPEEEIRNVLATIQKIK